MRRPRLRSQRAVTATTNSAEAAVQAATTAVAWAPAMVAAWTAASALFVVAVTARWERRRGHRILFPAGVRQRAADPYLLYTAPR